MGDAEDLVGPAQRFQAAADRFGCFTTDAGVDFIKHKQMVRGPGALPFDTGFDGERDARNFAAGSNFIEFSGFFAEVGGNEEADGVGALRGPRRGRQGDAEAGPCHGEGGQFFFDAFFQFFGGVLPRRGQ